MGMKAPLLTGICSETDCTNNMNNRATALCAKCGRCSEHLHSDCDEDDRTVYGKPE
jgi:hypothetical protein